MDHQAFDVTRDARRRLAVRCRCQECGNPLTAAQGLVVFSEVPGEPIAMSFLCRRCDLGVIQGQGVPGSSVRTLAWFMANVAKEAGVTVGDLKAEFDRIDAS